MTSNHDSRISGSGKELSSTEDSGKYPFVSSIDREVPLDQLKEAQ
jgi:hypothetical protein